MASRRASLDLSGLDLREVPSEIASLTQLTELNLSNNQLTSLPPQIASLTQLTMLNLGGNELRLLPPEIASLTQLVELYLWGNQLRLLASQIASLTHLTKLSLSHNALTSLPPEIVSLAQLTELDLSHNALTSLPPEIASLAQLTTLDLHRNKMTSVPPWIASLARLTKLALDANQLTMLPPEIASLAQLTLLDLARNQLTSLPQEIVQLAKLEELYLHDNEALRIPSEILGPMYNEVFAELATPTRPAEILEYYFRSLREISRPLLEAKVLVVGQGGVGKTSLVKRLVHDEFDPEEGKTEGIDIVRWQIPGKKESESIRVNIWDFGGQEIMHATHQFFLTRRSLYVLVLDARKGENEGNLHYWLRIIRSFGGDSPVLVVTNKFEPPNQLELNETRLTQDLAPRIRGFFRTSCQEGSGLGQLRQAIAREIRALEHVYDLVPQSFFSVKEEIEARTQTNDFLEVGEYEAICQQHNLEEEHAQQLLLRFLHDLGSVLNFSDPDSPYLLEETKILNPEWVTRGVYKVLNNNGLMNARGVLKLAQLGRILRRDEGYPKNRRLFIVGMMRKFELCFDFPEGDGRLLVPELLSRNEPDLGWDEEDALRFEFHYAVLPEGLLPRFITRSHQHLTAKPTYWRSGVLLEIDGNRALVRADTQAGRIYIAVLGPSQGRRRALAVVRAELTAIHRTVPGLEARPMVPLPRDPGKVEDHEHLLRLEAEGEDSYLPVGARTRYRVRELLDGIEEPEQRSTAMEVTIGNKYQIHYTGGNTFQQIYQGAADDLDLPQMARELAELRGTLQREASNVEQYRALAAVSEAEEAAETGDGPTALKRLKAAGQWTLDVATKIGIPVAQKAIQSAIGL